MFLGARRWVLNCTSLAEANRVARQRGQKGVSAQLLCLRAKIAEIDRLARRLGQDRICETHPELVFRRLNDGMPLPPQKTAQGHALRRKLLKDQGFDDLDPWLARRRGTGAKPDDVLDACACAIAARERRAKLPKTDPRIDASGLRMEIHF